MKQITLSLLTLIFSVNAFAIYDPTWERPVLSASMNIVEAVYALEEAADAEVTLYQRDGAEFATSLSITYSIPSDLNGDRLDLFRDVRQSSLQIDEVYRDSCGSTVFLASKSDHLGGRENLRLVDHRTRLCRDRKAYQWEATYRTGFGWCGTMDSILELRGNPEAVITIQ